MPKPSIQKDEHAVLAQELGEAREKLWRVMLQIEDKTIKPAYLLSDLMSLEQSALRILMSLRDQYTETFGEDDNPYAKYASLLRTV